jgi:hypothetical protein
MRLALFVVGLAVTTIAAAPQHRPALYKDSRQGIAIARAQGRSDVVLLVAAREGATSKVEAEAARLGGAVRFKDEESGYLRVRIPIEHAAAFSEFAAIEAVAFDADNIHPIRLDDGQADSQAPASPELQNPSAQDEVWPPRMGDYPLRNPYSPLADLDAAKFRAEHPTWDGRGVTIAVMDGNFDLLLPEFQTAYTLDGQRVPKVADFLNVADPRDDFDHTPQWVDMRQSASATGGKVAINGKTYSVSRDGTYRVGIFSERRFNRAANAAYIDQDIDRNGNPKGDDGLFAVVWDDGSNDVWVDTNRDGSFTDEKAMTDYRTRGDIGVFGRDDPATPIRESVGFAVQTDRTNKFVSINVGIYQHSSGILGTVVGNRQPGGRLDGIAPGARLVSVAWNSTGHGLAEGLIASFKHPLVDLVVLEQSVAITSIPYALADARHPISIITQRLIDRYKKLLFVPGNNLPAFAFVAEDGLAPGAVSVGGYQSRESYRLNAGFVPEHYDNLHWGALSHGPSGTGALKPDLLAPSGQMSTDPGYRKGGAVRGLFQLPPGYGIGSGTSTATPTAAGATALVLSAAKQSGVKYDAVRLKAALTRSARFIPRLGAHEQGNGLLQVAAAFEMLQKLQTTEVMKIESAAPVKHRLSGLLTTAHRGEGIYEREGWKVGDRSERTITLVRRSGPREPVEFTLTWEGNDGTFSAARSVTLPLNRPVDLPVVIAATKEGAHSAILRLDHASMPGFVHRILNTIVVPYEFTSAKNFSIQADVTPPVPGDTSVFVNVPAGAMALTASTAPGVRLSFISPTRDSRWRASCPIEPQAGKTVCSVSRPAAGVWEINLVNQAGRTFDPDAPSPLKAKPFTVNASLVAVDITSAPESLPLTGGAVSFTLANRLARVNAEASSLALGSAASAQRTIKRGEQHVYEILVPAGATSLRAKVAEVADASADLDIYLLDCSDRPAPADPPAQKEQERGNKSPIAPEPKCGPRAKADDLGSDGEVEVTHPAAGRWVVVVDAFAVPAGETTYRYLDVFTHPKFGTLAVSDFPADRSSSGSWTVRGHAWVAEVPEAPRRLHARVLVTSAGINQPVRTVEGFDASGIRTWQVPLGALDLTIAADKVKSDASRR